MPAAAKSWFKLTAKNDDTVEIDIFDEIGSYGVNTKSFVKALRDAGKVKNITLNIDSPGGDCNDGFTIYDAITGAKANVTANIIGLAASMASVIMLAAKTIRIAENGRVMIHRVTGGAFGNPDDLNAAAEVTKKFEDRIVALYVKRTGKPEDDIRDFMKADLGTWFFGQEAVDSGFADEVITGTKARAFQAGWAKHFKMLPAALFDTASNPEPAKPASTPPISTAMKPEEKARLRALLAQDKRTAEEDTELATLQAAAKKENYDPEIDMLKDRLSKAEKIAADFVAAKEKADKEAKEKEEKENSPSALKERIAKLEKIIDSGALGSLGGTAPVGGAKPGEQPGEKSPPKTEAELEAALKECKTHDERMKMINAFKAKK